jgi:hypothetical protein
MPAMHTTASSPWLTTIGMCCWLNVMDDARRLAALILGSSRSKRRLPIPVG